MLTKTVGATGVHVSALGLGTAFLGDLGRGDERATYSFDEESATAALDAALQGGVTLIDTAPLYGRTRVESLLGHRVLGDSVLRERIHVATKVGRKIDGIAHDYDSVYRSVLASAARLGVEQIDFVSIHDAADQEMSFVMSDLGTMGALRRLRDEGVVRFIGTATNDPDVNADYIETGEFDYAVISSAWSLLNRRLEERIAPAAERQSLGLLIATPLERGLLATGPVPGAVYQSRQFHPDVLEHVRVMKNACDAHGVPLIAAALQWPARHPLVASVLVGARTKEEAAANAEAASLPISDDFWAEFEPLVRAWDKTYLKG